MRWFLSVIPLALVAGAAFADPIRRDQIGGVDGDTVRIDGGLVRLLGFDTPETTFGWYRCNAELERGLLAAKRLAEILDSGAIDIEFATRRDRYKRRLARLTVDGRDVGEILIGERLAVRYGCPLTAA